MLSRLLDLVYMSWGQSEAYSPTRSMYGPRQSLSMRFQYRQQNVFICVCVQGSYNRHPHFGDLGRLRIGMLDNYHLHHDLRGSDCATNSFRQQNRDKRKALCNWSNADMQSANDQTLSPVALDGKKLVRLNKRPNWPRKRIKHRKSKQYHNYRKGLRMNCLKILHAQFIPVQNPITYLQESSTLTWILDDLQEPCNF